MLGVDERGVAARALGLRDHVEGERGLPGGLRPVDLRDAPARDPADAERHVDGEGAGRDDRRLLERARRDRASSRRPCRTGARSGTAPARALAGGPCRPSTRPSIPPWTPPSRPSVRPRATSGSPGLAACLAPCRRHSRGVASDMSTEDEYTTPWGWPLQRPPGVGQRGLRQDAVSRSPADPSSDRIRWSASTRTSPNPGPAPSMLASPPAPRGSRARASVTWGWKGRLSPGMPRATSAASSAAWSVPSASPPAATPAHTTRGARPDGKPPSPPRLTVNGGGGRRRGHAPRAGRARASSGSTSPGTGASDGDCPPAPTRAPRACPRSSADGPPAALARRPAAAPRRSCGPPARSPSPLRHGAARHGVPSGAEQRRCHCPPTPRGRGTRSLPSRQVDPPAVSPPGGTVRNRVTRERRQADSLRDASPRSSGRLETAAAEEIQGPHRGERLVALPVAVEAVALDDGLAGVREGHEDRPDRLRRRAAVGAGDAGDGDPEVGAARARVPRAPSPRRRPPRPPRAPAARPPARPGASASPRSSRRRIPARSRPSCRQPASAGDRRARPCRTRRGRR